MTTMSNITEQVDIKVGSNPNLLMRQNIFSLNSIRLVFMTLLLIGGLVLIFVFAVNSKYSMKIRTECGIGGGICLFIVFLNILIRSRAKVFSTMKGVLPSMNPPMFSRMPPMFSRIPQTQSMQYAPQAQSMQYAPQAQSMQYAPQTQSMQYAPQTQSMQYAPQTQSMQYAPLMQPMNWMH
jgi:hypothetical protein